MIRLSAERTMLPPRSPKCWRAGLSHASGDGAQDPDCWGRRATCEGNGATVVKKQRRLCGYVKGSLVYTNLRSSSLEPKVVDGLFLWWHSISSQSAFKISQPVSAFRHEQIHTVACCFMIFKMMSRVRDCPQVAKTSHEGPLRSLASYEHWSIIMIDYTVGRKDRVRSITYKNSMHN